MSARGYHIVFGNPIDAEKTREEAAAGLAPRHFLLEIADRLNARIWSPDATAEPKTRTLADRIARIGPATAALAEEIAGTVADDDVIFCNSEGASLPIADRLLKAGKKTRLSSFAHNLLRPRIAALGALTGILGRHDEIVVVSPMLAEGLKKKLGDKTPVWLFREQTDNVFFTPGAAAAKPRPLIMSVGMEQRDYRTLAEAAGDLDLDIRISGFSRDTNVTSRALPESLPANMNQRFYEWRDLAQLYRDADIVIAPVFENKYAAGITTILEGMAAGRPVIASKSQGLEGFFADENAVRWVPPEDAGAMRAAITELLADPRRRETLIARATAAFQSGHTFDGQADVMASRIRKL